MSIASLSADTQAALLLCATFGQKVEGPVKPFAAKEYSELARLLELQALGPADLLEPSTMDKAERSANGEVDWERIRSLLERGSALAFAVEGWASRGIWVLGQNDDAFPSRLTERLKGGAPPIFYGVGNRELLKGGGVAIVGSRDVDDAGTEFSRRLGGRCAREGMQVISGAARGVDSEAMAGALEAGGRVVGVLAEQLVRAAVSSHLRSALEEGSLVLVTPYDPQATFQVGRAMGRNKHLYALSDVAVVVSSAAETGGTWAGAIENLKQKWVPLFVRAGPDVPQGNQVLLKRGALSLDSTLLANEGELRRLFSRQDGNAESPTSALDPFDAVWPRLAALLNEKRSEKELLELMQVKRKQLRDWLARAIQLGKIEKRKNPVRYVIAGEDKPQRGLF